MANVNNLQSADNSTATRHPRRLIQLLVVLQISMLPHHTSIPLTSSRGRLPDLDRDEDGTRVEVHDASSLGYCGDLTEMAREVNLEGIDGTFPIMRRHTTYTLP